MKFSAYRAKIWKAHLLMASGFEKGFFTHEWIWRNPSLFCLFLPRRSKRSASLFVPNTDIDNIVHLSSNTDKLQTWVLCSNVTHKHTVMFPFSLLFVAWKESSVLQTILLSRKKISLLHDCCQIMTMRVTNYCFWGYR